MEGRAAQRRSIALLAVVAGCARQGVSRDKVQRLLWPEADADQAGRCLKQAIYVVRQGLGPGAIVGVQHLRLGLTTLSCDLLDFEDRLAQGDVDGAVAVYGGPFLDAFHLSGDSAAFDPWAAAKREHLARAHIEALEAQVDGATARGDHRAALPAARVLSALSPLDPRYARSVMEALSALGDSLGAMRHGERYRRVVLEELGDDAVRPLAR